MLTSLGDPKNKVTLAVDLNPVMLLSLFQIMSRLIEYPWEVPFESQLEDDIENA